MASIKTILAAAFVILLAACGNLAPFGRWTLRDKAVQRRSTPTLGVMRHLPLLLCLIAANAIGANVFQQYKVFYCIHRKAECVSSDNPVAMSRADALSLIKVVVAEKDAFVGFVDSKDVTLQFYTQGPNKIWVEIPAPKEKGSFGTLVTEQKAIAVVRQLSGDLEAERKALGLRFQAW